MSFEIYIAPGSRLDPLKPGTCSIGNNGDAIICTEDLRAVELDGSATILIDRALGRIAIRKPKPGERPAKIRNVSKNGTTARLGLHGSLRALRADPGQVKGRRPITRKDDLLIIEIT